MIGIANFPNITYYPIRAKIEFNNTINKLLQNGKTVHFYPEGSLWPYYEKIRHFKDGAFRFAVENNIPIIPMVYTFEQCTGILRYIKKKPAIALTILEPIYPDVSLDKFERIKKIKQETYNKMKNVKSS